MKVIPRGLLIRCIAMVLGAIPLTILLHVVEPPGKLAGVTVLVYAAALGIMIADYGAKHPDEFPDDSERR